MVFKKAIDISNFGKKTLDALSDQTEEAKAIDSGVGGTSFIEPLPNYISAQCERVVSNDNGAYLVLGRDRPADRMSGYGGSGDTGAAAIDLVAGRMGGEARKLSKGGEQFWVDPDFKKDAARVYISQKSDPDDYFDLASGKIGKVKTRSMVGVKADEVRIMARGGIKLVTRTEGENSQGARSFAVSGIDLIAGNDDDDLQPMAMGGNVRDAIERLAEHQDKLAGVVDTLIMITADFNRALMSHTHHTMFFATPTTPSIVLLKKGVKNQVDLLKRAKLSVVNHKRNLAGFKLTYLSPIGGKYICSRRNNNN